MPMAKKATMPMASFIGCALDLDIVYVKLPCTLIIYKTYNLHPMNSNCTVAVHCASTY
jgi:hypothetical protein